MKTRTGYLLKRGKVYYACWSVGTQKFVKTTKETDRDEAQKKLDELMEAFLIKDEIKTLQSVQVKIQQKRGDLVTVEDARNPPLSIAGTWPAFLASQNRPRTGKATMEVYELTWGRFQSWMEANHPEVKALRDITKDIAEKFAASLTEGQRSNGTFNKYMNVLSLVFRTVSEKAKLTANPWANPMKDGHGQGIRRKAKKTHGRRELTFEELQKVFNAAEGDLRLLLAIGMYTGLRLGDCATLRWGEVDLVRGMITRIANKTGTEDPTPVKIPIYPDLHALLQEIPKATRSGPVLPRIDSDYKRHISYVTDRTQKLFADCDIETTRKIEGQLQSQVEVGFHSLRHSFVSMCSENKVPLAVVQRMVGHSNPAMTRHYDHAEHELDKVAAVAGLPSMTGKPIKALPAPHLVDPGPAVALLETMTGRNWAKVQKEVLNLLKRSAT
jgi:integrase